MRSQGESSITVDFATNVQRIIALGFNAVKLPFTFAMLFAISSSKAPMTCKTASDADIQAST